jgi:excisionase family DNA binding protein
LTDSLRLLTVDQLCALLQVKPSWVYDSVAAGHLPTVRVGRHLRFRAIEIDAWLSSSSSGGPTAATASPDGVVQPAQEAQPAEGQGRPQEVAREATIDPTIFNPVSRKRRRFSP